MQQHLHDSYHIPQTVDLESLFKKWRKKFGLEHQPGVEEKVTLCDTFDWALFHAGYICIYGKSGWTLFDRQTGAIRHQGQGPRPVTSCFADEFKKSILRETLSKILDIRSLLPLTSGTISIRETQVLNKDHKTVVRLFYEQHQMEDVDQSLRIIRLEPVRGYTGELKAVAKLLHDFESVDKPSVLLDLEQGTAQKGRSPGDYSSRFHLYLDPDQTAGSAVVDIYKKLLVAIYMNLPGTIDDLDSEFLHDLRVAVRRTRSALALIKNVLPPAKVAKYKDEFAYLGEITGSVRDLDVYLLYEREYKKQLPECLQEGLNHFFEDLAGQKKVQHKRMAKELQGERVTRALASWGDYLEYDDEHPAKKAELPVIDIARTIIFKRYKRVMNDGLAITPVTPDKKLHRLRIQGKKLRYAIEFFSSLFPEKEIRKAIRRLKQLQNYLGDFNDLSVQQDMLRSYLQGVRPGSRKNQMLGAALGGLMGNLHQEQLKMRSEFAEVFTTFSGEKNRVVFENLFIG